MRRRLRLELDDVARKRALQGYEIPRDFVLERDAFSKANHLLTDSGKPAVGRLREKCAPTPRSSARASLHHGTWRWCRMIGTVYIHRWLVCPGARCRAAHAEAQTPGAGKCGAHVWGVCHLHLVSEPAHSMRLTQLRMRAGMRPRSRRCTWGMRSARRSASARSGRAAARAAWPNVCGRCGSTPLQPWMHSMSSSLHEVVTGAQQAYAAWKTTMCSAGRTGMLYPAHMT